MKLLKIAGVQMDVVPKQALTNAEHMLRFARQAVAGQARVIVFPECALTGYCFDSREEAWQAAIAIDDPAIQELVEFTRHQPVTLCFGTLLKDPELQDPELPGSEHKVFNAVLTCAHGKVIDTYYKIHLPFLGVDRFVTPGDRIHTPLEIEGVRFGIHICYEGGFPEVGRCLALAGADVLLLPTNWPPGSGASCRVFPSCRAIENKVYFMAINRVGKEGDTPFIGNSSICDVSGQEIQFLAGPAEGILYADIDPQTARQKKVVHQAGVYEVDRIGDRRPDLYGPLTGTET